MKAPTLGVFPRFRVHKDLIINSISQGSFGLQRSIEKFQISQHASSPDPKRILVDNSSSQDKFDFTLALPS